MKKKPHDPFVLCYSQKDFEYICRSNGYMSEDTFPKNTAYISITNNDECANYLGEDFAETNVHLLPDSEHVLNVEFDDITQDVITVENGVNIRGLSDATADKIVAYIDKFVGHDFVVHCRAGKSRSQAVVRYIIDTYPDTYSVARINHSNPPRLFMVNYHALKKLKDAYERMTNMRSQAHAF